MIRCPKMAVDTFSVNQVNGGYADCTGAPLSKENHSDRSVRSAGPQAENDPFPPECETVINLQSLPLLATNSDQGVRWIQLQGY